MTRIASALIQCVMRTTKGWTFTHSACCPCAACIESPLCAVADPPWSANTGYTLQCLPAVPFAESEKRSGESPAERDHFEQFPHLGGAHEPVRLIRKRQKPRAVLGRRSGHDLRNPAIHEELGLAGVTEQIQPAFPGRAGDCAEIDMRGNVLQPRREERIGMSVMAVVAHEGAVRALRVVILSGRKTVIDEK